MLQPWNSILCAFIIHCENRLGGYGAVVEIPHYKWRRQWSTVYIWVKLVYINNKKLTCTCYSSNNTMQHCFSLLLHALLKSLLSACCTVQIYSNKKKKKKHTIIGRKMLSESLTSVSAIILKEGTISVISNAIGWWACVIFEVKYLHNENWKLGEEVMKRSVIFVKGRFRIHEETPRQLSVKSNNCWKI